MYTPLHVHHPAHAAAGGRRPPPPRLGAAAAKDAACQGARARAPFPRGWRPPFRRDAAATVAAATVAAATVAAAATSQVLEINGRLAKGMTSFDTLEAIQL